MIGTLLAAALVGRRFRFPLTGEPEVIHTVSHVAFGCSDAGHVLLVLTTDHEPDECGATCSLVECDLDSPAEII